MTTMSISLSESLKDYVQERVSGGDFGNVSDYIRSLVREDKDRQEQKKLEALLLEGLESGEPIPVDKKWRNKKRAELEKRLERSKAS